MSLNIYNGKPSNLSKKLENIRKFVNKYTFDVNSRLNIIKMSLEESNGQYNSNILTNTITEIKRNKLQRNVIKKLTSEKKIDISKLTEIFMKNIKEGKYKKHTSIYEKFKKSISINFFEKKKNNG